MKILSVKINNILSIEDAFVEFQDTGLMLVQGWNHDVGRANGAGKTAIFNAITFALFDKLPRKITATEIVRRGSKGGSVQVVLQVGSDRFMVKRSRPKGVTFSRQVADGTFEPLTVTQEGWEATLRLNYNQFIMSMYTAQGGTSRFLSSNDSEKKTFLLQLLNLEEFSLCKSAADAKVKALDEQLGAVKTALSSIESKVSAYSESLVNEEMVRDEITEAEQVVANLSAELAIAQSVQRPDLSKYQKLEDDIAAKKTEFTKARTQREMLHELYRKTQSRIKPFNGSDKCDACGNELDNSAAEAAHRATTDALRKELLVTKTAIDMCDAALLNASSVNDLSIRLAEKKRDESRDYEAANNRSSSIQYQINSKQKDIKQLTLKLQNNLELTKKINSLEQSRTEALATKDSISRSIELYKTVSTMYSPTGAQAYILDSVIESFNEKVQFYVDEQWSNLTYKLKSYKENVRGDTTAKFSEHLVMDGKDISIGSLSGGEFRALSLCVDFALIDVMERQFGISMSPIILDESFHDLDETGREVIVELLETISRNRQVVVIDHSSEVKAHFSNVLNIEKRNGVSTVNLQS
jgi:DNA repair exonuclease SbcCD ATPase subunit